MKGTIEAQVSNSHISFTLGLERNITIVTLGGRTGIPTLEMVDTFLKTGVVKTSQLDERRSFYKTAMFG